MKFKGAAAMRVGLVLLAAGAALAFCTPAIELVVPHYVRADALPDSGLWAVVALSSGAIDDTTLDDVGTSRLRAAVALARAAKARRIVTTRIMLVNGGSTDSAQGRIIARAGLSAQWVVLSGVVHNTRDEATNLAAILDTNNRVAVVTSALHTIRACAAFEAVGFRVTCVPAKDPERGTLRRRGLALYAFVYERLAIRKYRFKGWMR